MTPLLLFHLMQCIVRFYCRQLANDIKNTSENLSVQFQKFLRITNLQSLLSDLYGAWMLFSWAWSIFTICLTIYFATEVDSSLSVPEQMIIGLNESEIGMIQMTLRFNIGWSVMQIVFAFIYLVSICFAGRMTNETTRVILKRVLNTVGSHSTEDDRSQATFFVFQMSMQPTWGVTVWRTFPIERGVFFTISSLITTYVVVLLKMRREREH